MYTLRPTTEFRRNVRYLERCREDMSLLKVILEKLRSGDQLPEWSKDENYYGTVRRCAFGAGMLLLYDCDEENEQVLLISAGREEIIEKRPNNDIQWLKQLVRSPVKTLLTILLITAVTFGLATQIGEYVVTEEAVKRSVQTYHGAGTIENGENPLDPDIRRGTAARCYCEESCILSKNPSCR